MELVVRSLYISEQIFSSKFIKNKGLISISTWHHFLHAQKLRTWQWGPVGRRTGAGCRAAAAAARAARGWRRAAVAPRWSWAWWRPAGCCACRTLYSTRCRLLDPGGTTIYLDGLLWKRLEPRVIPEEVWTHCGFYGYYHKHGFIRFNKKY